jgi:hypothetical protein
MSERVQVLLLCQGLGCSHGGHDQAQRQSGTQEQSRQRHEVKDDLTMAPTGESRVEEHK